MIPPCSTMCHFSTHRGVASQDRRRVYGKSKGIGKVVLLRN